MKIGKKWGKPGLLRGISLVLSGLLLFAGCSVAGDSGTAGAGSGGAEGNASADSSRAAPEEKSQVTIGFSQDPDTWDPCAGFGYSGSPLFSTLVRVNGDNEVEGDLSTGWEVSPDGLHWTFSLREGVVFSDGSTLTAQDVVFTFSTAQDKATYVDLTMLESCVAPDASTVVFTLSKPYVTFLYTVAGMGIVPESGYGEGFGMAPIGSGPYTLAQWDKGQQFIFQANPLYYGEKPEIDRAVFLVQEEDARFLAAQGGTVDIALTSATLATTEIPGMTVLSVGSVDNRGITLPTVPNEGEHTADGYPIGNDITSDKAVRQALAYGIDRQQIIDEALNGFAKPAYTECDGLPWWNPETVVETDVEAAHSLLEQGGWVDTNGDGIREKDGLKAELNLMYFAGDSMRQAVAMSVANQARENLGIAFTVEGVSANDTVARMFSEPMIMGWGSDSPMTSYLLYHSSNAGKTDFYNPEWFTNEKVDGYLDQAMNALSLEESLPWWKKAQFDGTTGTSMKGEAPWAFYVNMSHLYYKKEGLNVGKQRIHAHGAAWPLVANLAEWTWEDTQ